MKKNTFLLIIFLSLFIGVKADVSAKSFVVMEVNTGHVLYSKSKDVKTEMASTTKVMTALLAIESGKLDNSIIIKKEWTGIEGSSIYLKENDRYTLRELVYGLMLRSGNDASIAIAGYISGSTEKFVELMNKRAKEMGLVNTNFTNPNGLPDLNHYTSAYDLGMITAIALREPFFAQVVATKTFTNGEGEDRKSFTNKNKLLWQYEGGNGVKTGYTIRAGKCLVASAKREGLWIISVVLNCPNMWEDAKYTMNHVFNNYKYEKVVEGKKNLQPVKIKGGKQKYVESIAEQDFYIPMRKDGKDRVELVINYKSGVKAPIEKNADIGSINILLNDEFIGKTKIIAAHDIIPKNVMFFLKKVINNI